MFRCLENAKENSLEESRWLKLKQAQATRIKCNQVTLKRASPIKVSRSKATKARAFFLLRVARVKHLVIQRSTKISPSLLSLEPMLRISTRNFSQTSTLNQTQKLSWKRLKKKLKVRPNQPHNQLKSKTRTWKNFISQTGITFNPTKTN